MCFNDRMKSPINDILMRTIRRFVVILERVFKINISRFPLEKFYSDFVELANLELVSQSHGILHIGAHLGLEAEEYSSKGKPVIFIEADPETFKRLEERVSPFQDMRAFNFLLGDEEKIVRFFRASNSSESSSIFEFSEKNVFQNVSTSNEIDIKMFRLDSRFTSEDLKEFDHWVIDVQGAELLILRGAGELLKICKTLFVECSTDEFYVGGAKWEEILKFMQLNGYKYFISPGKLKHLNVIFFKNS